MTASDTPRYDNPRKVTRQRLAVLEALRERPLTRTELSERVSWQAMHAAMRDGDIETTPYGLFQREALLGLTWQGAQVIFDPNESVQPTDSGEAS